MECHAETHHFCCFICACVLETFGYIGFVLALYGPNLRSLNLQGNVIPLSFT